MLSRYYVLQYTDTQYGLVRKGVLSRYGVLRLQSAVKLGCVQPLLCDATKFAQSSVSVSSNQSVSAKTIYIRVYSICIVFGIGYIIY